MPSALRATPSLALPYWLLFCLALGWGAAQAAPAGSHDSAVIPELSTCAGMKDLAFVGHMDDDLLFMNPDILNVIREGACVRVVYLTASERNEGETYMRNREQAVQAAYAYMAGQANEWIEQSVQVGAYRVAGFTLSGRPGIQLWHLRLQDPWLGPGWGSLTPLSRTESDPKAPVETLEAFPQRYLRSDLIETLATIIRTYGPTTIRHLDDTNVVPYTQLCWRCAGHGHPDHIASARLVREAMMLAPGNYAQVGYIDYPIQEQAINLSPTEIADKTEAFRRYAWVDYRYCKGPEDCQQPAGPAAAWVGRAYYVARQDTSAVLVASASSSQPPSVLTTGELNDTINLWQPDSAQWQSLGGRSSEAPDLAVSAHGETMFSRDATGRIWLSTQVKPGQWAAWQTLSGARLNRMPAVAPEGHAAIGMGTDNRYYWTAARAGQSAWSPWSALPTLPDARYNAAASIDNEGRLIALALDAHGQLHLSRQASQGATLWAPWQLLSSPALNAAPSAIHDGQGKLSIFIQDPDTRHLLRLEPAHATTKPTQDLGLTLQGRPALALNSQGRVVVALRNGDAELWVLQGGGRIKLADVVASDPSLRLLGGHLYLTARASGPAQQYLIWRHELGKWQALPSTTEPPKAGGYAFQRPILASDTAPTSSEKPDS